MALTRDNIFLIGPMGSGKTTIGRLLARELGMEFVDSDHEIEERTGADIPWIFDVEGESGFRARESRVIADLTQRRGIVLATGGGAVLAEENRRHLRSNGRVVYLLATLGQLVERTKRDQKRPLLRDAPDPRARLEQIMTERDPLYREIADHVVVTNRRSPKTVCMEIMEKLAEA